MSTTIASVSHARGAKGVTQLGPIVCATDGTTSSDSALQLASQLAKRDKADLVVVAVLEPVPMLAAEYGMLLPPLETDQERRDALTGRVKLQMREIGGDASNSWALDVRSGDPAVTIVRAATEVGARLIVMGQGHHDFVDRMLGSETAIHVIRRGRTPVLTVPVGCTQLPERVAIATDFSAASVHAARTALNLLPGIELVYVTHVAPTRDVPPSIYNAWLSAHNEGADRAFKRVVADLAIPDGTVAETMTLTGNPAKSLVEFAKAARLQLIVTGSRGAGFVDRLLVGSTATGLVRRAECCVLAVPTPATHSHADSDTVQLPRAQWAKGLQEFTDRNAARIASVEVDDMSFGAQAQLRDYPLLGAAYDHVDDRVDLMFGDQQSTRRHLSRGIPNPLSVDILRDKKGNDLALHIAHESGQTIVTFDRPRST
jgi:nucleotide-binding universal stress UspA family protein